MSAVLGRVTEIVAEVFGEPVGTLTLETRFVEDLNESLEFTETVIACEEAFGLSIAAKDAAHFLTIGLLASYIEGRLSCPPTVWPPPPKMPNAENAP